MANPKIAEGTDLESLADLVSQKLRGDMPQSAPAREPKHKVTFLQRHTPWNPGEVGGFDDDEFVAKLLADRGNKGPIARRYKEGDELACPYPENRRRAA